jgi:5-methylcytosine-specific restriction endonuclease McrA
MDKKIRDLYKHKRWIEMRDKEIAHHPICALCGSKATLTADHINPPANEDAFWSSPIQTICRKCHSKKLQSRR